MLGVFLKEFHQRTIVGAPTMTEEAQQKEYQEKFELARPVLVEHFSDDEFLYIQDFVMKMYPTQMRELGFLPGLCHGDLTFRNMIYAPHKPIGVIDFGDVGYYDTSVDFSSMGDGVVRTAALKGYGNPDLERKVNFRMRIQPIIGLPFFIGKKDTAGIEKQVREIRSVFFSG